MAGEHTSDIASSLGARSLDWHDGDEPMVTIPARVLTDAIHELDWWLSIAARTAGETHSYPSEKSAMRLAALLEAARRHDGSQFRLSDESAVLIVDASMEIA